MNRGEELNYTRYINLDVNAMSAVTVVTVKRSDAFARFINVTLMKDGVKYTPESGVWAMFRCEKPDGTAVVTDSRTQDTELGRYLVTIESNGTITIELIDQVTTAVGRCKCDVCLMYNTEVLSTTQFIIDVKPIPNVAELVVSSDDFRTLINAIAEIEDIESSVVDNVATLTLPTNWSGNNPYTQTISVSGYTVTANTRVDLMCNAETINAMAECGTNIIYVVNNNGTLTAYALGAAPNVSLTVQAVLSETQAV